MAVERHPRGKGFTLIELLIVVAIIAILAAIAVPNFLEAQTRSKVARVKNDMRNLATSVESYIVDNNLILGTDDLEQKLGLSQQMARLNAYARLTTPIAYMTSFPNDPFMKGHSGVGGNRDDNEFQFQASNTFNTGNWKLPRRRGYTWGFSSHGPALRRTGPTFINVLRGKTDITRTYLYDPTNGTVSEGFLMRTNKGEAFVDNAPPV